MKPTHRNAFRGGNFDISEKAIRKLNGDLITKIKPTSVDWCEKEIAIEIHCDAGKILTKAGSWARIGICGFLRKQITEKTKNVEYRQGISV